MFNRNIFFPDKVSWHEVEQQEYFISVLFCSTPLDYFVPTKISGVSPCMEIDKKCYCTLGTNT